VLIFLWAIHTYFFFLCFVFFYYILNLLTISVKCKYVKECFFFFFKKEQIIKRVKKKKKKDIEKLFFSSLKIQFLWIYSLASKSWISHFLGCIIFINTRVWLKIFVINVHDVKVGNIIWKIKKKEKHFFSDFRQDWQCSLFQVVRLRGDNIFHFT